MDQLQLNFNTTGLDGKWLEYVNKYVADSTSSFKPMHVHDKNSSKDASAIQCTQNWPEEQLVVRVIIIPDDTFVTPGFLYLDTVFKDPQPGCSFVNPINEARSRYEYGKTLDIVCYMNFPPDMKVINLHKNFKTMIRSYYLKCDNLTGSSLSKIPSVTDRIPDWITYNPSVNMYAIRSEFVLEMQRDYANIPTCFYRSGFDGKENSILYKYANKASTSVCSNEYLEEIAMKDNKVCQCPYFQPDAIRGCSFYKEDKMTPFQTELYSMGDENHLAAVIDCHIIREILSECYSIIFEKTDVSSGRKTTLKKFSYANVSLGTFAQPDALITEALLQNNLILSDYTSSYKAVLLNHVQSFVELKKKPETKSVSSYISTLVS